MWGLEIRPPLGKCTPQIEKFFLRSKGTSYSAVERGPQAQWLCGCSYQSMKSNYFGESSAEGQEEENKVVLIITWRTVLIYPNTCKREPQEQGLWLLSMKVSSYSNFNLMYNKRNLQFLKWNDN